MTIYFTASLSRSQKDQQYYNTIVSILKKRGHDVIADQILQKDRNTIQDQSPEERKKYFEKVEHWLTECDAIVAEVTNQSVSVGYEISRAQHLKKPILILFHDTNAPSLLQYQPDESVICELYNLRTMDSILDEFLEYAGETQDSRFTFFIKPSLTAHLEKKARELHTTKSGYLRGLIKKDMTSHS